MEKNKILNFQHLKNAILAKDQDLDQDIMPVHALCVVVMVKLDQAKDFLLFNKHVHSVQAQVKKLQIHAILVMGKEKNKLPKDFQFQFQKGLMMEQE